MDRQWMILFVVMAITFFLPKDTIPQRNLCIRLSALSLILFSGLRSWWYGDLKKYYSLFLDVSDSSFFDIYSGGGIRNIGIKVCFRVMYALFGKYGYDIFIFVVAFFSIATLSLLISNYSPSPYYSYLMYIGMGLYSFTYTGLKQTIAMGFCCLAMNELLGGTTRRFILFVILGGLFHTPAFIFLLAWPMSRKEIDLNYFIIVIAGILLVFFLRDRIAVVLEGAYYSTEITGGLTSNGKVVGGRFIMMVAILLGSTLMRPPNRDDVVYSRIYSVMVLAVALQMFCVYDNTYTRLADYFFQFIVLFTPLFMEEYEYNSNGKKRLYGVFTNNSMLYLGAGFVITLFLLWFYKNQIEGITNFRFLWEFDAHHFYGN